MNHTEPLSLRRPSATLEDKGKKFRLTFPHPRSLQTEQSAVEAAPDDKGEPWVPGLDIVSPAEGTMKGSSMQRPEGQETRAAVTGEGLGTGREGTEVDAGLAPEMKSLEKGVKQEAGQRSEGYHQSASIENASRGRTVVALGIPLASVTRVTHS